MAESWRVALICSIRPLAEGLAAKLGELGHEPVVLLAPRRERLPPQPPDLALTDATAPPRIDLAFVRSTSSIEPLLRAYQPDLMLCWGFPWKIPQEALDVPRLGSINQHPALLPRHRGPFPLAWAFRDGCDTFGSSWHYMDAELDTGNVLAQGTVPIDDDDVHIADFGPRVADGALELLPRALERVAAGDPGDPQPAEGASWAGAFGEDYAHVDWSQPARAVHNQVRAWPLLFGFSDVRAPVAELDGEQVVLLETRLADPGGDARRVECGDGPLWVVSFEPV